MPAAPLKKDTRVSVSARQAWKPARNAKSTRLVTLPDQAVEFIVNGETIAIEFATVQNIRMMRDGGKCYGYVRRGNKRYRAWRLHGSSAWVAYPSPSGCGS